MSYWIINGRAESPTTELGLAAFEGRADFVRERIQRGIDWRQEGQEPLFGALFGGHRELARELLRAGAPITDDTYRMVFANDSAFLAELPPRPDLLAPLERERDWGRFQEAVFEGDLDEARRLLDDRIRPRINELKWHSHGLGELRPIHAAARRADVAMLRFLVEAGADVNALSGQGQSALRLVAEMASLGHDTRGAAVRYLESAGARYVPPVKSWLTRWTLRRGAWLRP